MTMPTADDILRQLEPIFQEILDIPDLHLTRSLNAKQVPEWDSLNHMRLLAAIEQQFAVRLASREVEALADVGDMADLVARKLG